MAQDVWGRAKIGAMSGGSLGRRQQMGQYYTDPTFSHLLVQNLSTAQPRTVVELGAGRGSLLRAASARWENAQLISVDIDKRNHEFLKQHYPGHIHMCADALSSQFPDELSHYVGKVTAAICNPPYLKPRWRREFGEILDEAGLSDSLITTREISADLIFLAQNLRLLAYGGELGIILPDSYITGEKHVKLRETLLSEHCINAVLQLPRRIYRGTEASTYIMLLTKGRTIDKGLPLLSVSNSGEVSKPIVISSQNAAQRMDYAFYEWRAAGNKSENISSYRRVNLSDIASISRGNLNYTEAKKQDISILHTIDFKKIIDPNNFAIEKSQEPTRENRTNYVTAEAGDILVARVGRKLELQMAFVTNGTGIISDCLYRIRAPERYRTSIWNALSSPQGREWIRAHARGVCALSITKTAMSSFPISELED